MDLNELKNKDCYKVPDNYFEELPKMVFQNIAKQKRTMTIRRSVIAIASLAASILLIVGIIQLRPTTQVPLVAQVDTTAQETTSTEIITAEAPAQQEAGIMTAQATYTKQQPQRTTTKHNPVRPLPLPKMPQRWKILTIRLSTPILKNSP